MKTEKWYQRRLAAYFTEHYSQYEDTAEYWSEPAINQWLFDIHELGARVELTCHDDGRIVKTEYPLEVINRYER